MSLFDRSHYLRPQASLQVDRPQPSPTYMNTLFTKLNQKAGAPWICDLVLSWMGYGQQASMLWPQTGQQQIQAWWCSIRSTILLGLRFRGQVNVKVQGARMTSILAHKSAVVARLQTAAGSLMHRDRLVQK